MVVVAVGVGGSCRAGSWFSARVEVTMRVLVARVVNIFGQNMIQYF